MISSLEWNDLVWRFGWMLLHSLWQIALIGMLLWATLRLTRNQSAHFRYWLACGGLAACFLPLIYTFTQVFPDRDGAIAGMTSSQPVVRSGENLLVEPDDPTVPAGSPERTGYFYISDNDPSVSSEPGNFSYTLIEDDEQTSPQLDASRFERLQTFMSPWLSSLVGMWVTGVGLFAIWNVGGWLLVQRLRRQGTPLSSDVIQQKIAILLERMQIGRAVKFLESMLVEVPVTIGWLKPVVLLPVGLMTSLTPDQVESVIAHELAHIRRHDYLVNLLQTLTESLLFYHPVVWWLSHTIRVEREFCCDDEAIAASGNRNSYVTALAAVETLRIAPAHALSLAGSHDGSTLSRMRRLMGVRHTGSQGWIAGLTTITLLLCVGLAVGFSQNPAIPETVTNAEEPIEEATEPRVQQQRQPGPRKGNFILDPETFRLDLTYFGESDKPFYDFSMGANVEVTEPKGFHLVEPTDGWEKRDCLPLFDWLQASGFYKSARVINQDEPPATRAYILRVTSGDQVWEEDLGFHLGMLMRLESLQRVLVDLDLKSRKDPKRPIGLDLLLARLSGYEKIWKEGQFVSDLKLKVSAENLRFTAGSPIPIKVQLSNTGNQPQLYDQHILSLFPGAIHVLDEYGRRVPYVGGTSQLRSQMQTLPPGESVLIEEFDLAQFNYLRRPGKYLMYAVHGNGIRSNNFHFEVTRSDQPEADFVGPLLPLVHEDWILVANPNFKGKIHPGKNFAKVEGFPVRFQCNPTGSIRDISHVWLYFTKTKADPLEQPIEQFFLPETSYEGKVGDHHLYVSVDEKSQERWPTVFSDVMLKVIGQKYLDLQRTEEKQQKHRALEERNQDLQEKLRELLQDKEQRKTDPISVLITKLDESGGLWINGLYPEVKLPALATPRDVLRKPSSSTALTMGKFRSTGSLRFVKGSRSQDSYRNNSIQPSGSSPIRVTRFC